MKRLLLPLLVLSLLLQSTGCGNVFVSVSGIPIRVPRPGLADGGGQGWYVRQVSSCLLVKDKQPIACADPAVRLSDGFESIGYWAVSILTTNHTFLLPDA